MMSLGFTPRNPNAENHADRLEEIFSARQVAKLRVQQLLSELQGIHITHDLDDEALDALSTSILTIVDQTTESIAALACSAEFDVVAKLRERVVPVEDLTAEV